MNSPSLAALAFVAVGACATSPAASPSSAAPQGTVPQAGAMVATLTPQNFSGGQVSGRIRLVPTQKAGELHAEIDLRGAGYQNQLPWIIRTGRCGETGVDIGTPLSYRPITTTADGSGQLRANVQVRIPEGQTVHVAILRSPSQRDQVIACGVLSYQD